MKFIRLAAPNTRLATFVVKAGGSLIITRMSTFNLRLSHKATNNGLPNSEAGIFRRLREPKHHYGLTTNPRVPLLFNVGLSPTNASTAAHNNPSWSANGKLSSAHA